MEQDVLHELQHALDFLDERIAIGDVAPKLVTHPVRPRAEKLDIAEFYRRFAARYPRILAELARGPEEPHRPPPPGD